MVVVPPSPHKAKVPSVRLTNLAVEGIYIFLFTECKKNSHFKTENRAVRWAFRGESPESYPPDVSASVDLFCILRSLNTRFWERSYEFLQPALSTGWICCRQRPPPLKLLKLLPDIRLKLAGLRTLLDEPSLLPLVHDAGKRRLVLHLHGMLENASHLDLRSLLSIMELELCYGFCTSLKPPVNIKSLYIDRTKVDLFSLIQSLEGTKICKLQVLFPKYGEQLKHNRLDLSRLNCLKDVRLHWGTTFYFLTPPPNIERLCIDHGQTSIDLFDLIRRLEQTNIRTLEIRLKTNSPESCQPPLDLSQLSRLQCLGLDGGVAFPTALPASLVSFSFSFIGTNTEAVASLYRARTVEYLGVRGVRYRGGRDLDLGKFPNLRGIYLDQCSFSFLSVPNTLETFELSNGFFDCAWLSKASGLRHVKIWAVREYQEHAGIKWDEIMDLLHCKDLKTVDCIGIKVIPTRENNESGRDQIPDKPFAWEL